MAEHRARSKLSRWLPSKDDALDGALDMTIKALDSSKDVITSVVSVPGLSIALDLTVQVLEKIQAAKTNRKALASLCEEIDLLVGTLRSLAELIQGGLQEYEAEPRERQEVEAKVSGSSVLRKRMDMLTNVLSTVRDKAVKLANRSRFGGFWHSGGDAEAINDMKDKIKSARERFQLEGDVNVEAIVMETFSDMKSVITEQRKLVASIKLAEEEQVLRSIPRAVDAHYRSAANAMKARLQTGTRERVFEVLEGWEETQTAETQSQPVCVLVGEAGTGKSTIASEFSKRLQERGHLGASFFFTRGVQELNSPRKFFSTIASQLAECQSKLRMPVINAAREHLKTATLQQLEHEFQDLILKPLSSLPPSHPPFFVVADALDECTEEGPELVPTLLRLFLSCATRAGSPLRVFLTSRPEPHYIHNVFATTDLQPRIATVSIQTFRNSVDSDIETLIRARLEESQTSRRWMNAHPEVVPALVKKSDGLFIFARTAIDFVLGDPDDSEFQLQERYEDLVKGDGVVGLAALDALYRTVLDSVFPRGDQHMKSQDRLKRVLGYLVALQAPDGISPKTLEALTGMRTVESVPVLNKLRSVVFFSRDNDAARFRIIHATFREFLVNEKRAGDSFYIDAAVVHAHLADDCTRTIKVLVADHWPDLDGAPLLLELLTGVLPNAKDIRHVRYAVKYINNHREHLEGQELQNQTLSEDRVPTLEAIARFASFREAKCMWDMMSAVLAHMRSSIPTQRPLIEVLHSLCIRDANGTYQMSGGTQNLRYIHLHCIYILWDIQAIGNQEIPESAGGVNITEDHVEELRIMLEQARTAMMDDYCSGVKSAHKKLHAAMIAAGVTPYHGPEGQQDLGSGFLSGDDSSSEDGHDNT